MKYPATIVDDDLGWGRIHLGHGLDREFLRRELFEANVEDPPHDDSDIVVEEVFYKYLPRIKRCSDYLIGGCDLEGEWHDHWYSVQPQRPEDAMTVVHWQRSANPT